MLTIDSLSALHYMPSVMLLYLPHFTFTVTPQGIHYYPCITGDTVKPSNSSVNTPMGYCLSRSFRYRPNSKTCACSTIHTIGPILNSEN